MYKDNKQSKNYRYERKIVVTSFNEQEIEMLVKQHPSLLKPGTSIKFNRISKNEFFKLESKNYE